MLLAPELGRRALVLAIGGGGDVASAAVLAAAYRRVGLSAVVASVAWERYVNDPVPGPIRLEEIVNCVELGDGYAVVSGSSYATRGGRRVVFQAARVAAALGENVYVADLYGGVAGYVRAIRGIAEREGVDVVVGVDVGGDSLATGYEEELWSPLADWVGVASLARLGGVLAVHSPGSDGELSQEYVLRRIDEVARRGGLIWGAFMSREDAELLERLLAYVESEASRVPLLAYRGFRGRHSMRRGSRAVDVTLLSTATFFLDARTVVEGVRPLEEIAATSSLEEARRRLNAAGIYTELDLEEDLARLGVDPAQLSGELLVEVRRRGVERLRGYRGRSSEPQAAPGSRPGPGK